MKTKTITLPITDAAATRLVTSVTTIAWRRRTRLDDIAGWCARRGLQIVWCKQRRSLLIDAT